MKLNVKQLRTLIKETIDDEGSNDVIAQIIDHIDEISHLYSIFASTDRPDFAEHAFERATELHDRLMSVLNEEIAKDQPNNRNNVSEGVQLSFDRIKGLFKQHPEMKSGAQKLELSGFAFDDARRLQARSDLDKAWYVYDPKSKSWVRD